jgi:hypothetical protein
LLLSHALLLVRYGEAHTVVAGILAVYRLLPSYPLRLLSG